MKTVLVLGAGLVARPLVRYLLDLPDIHVIVASRTVQKADELIAGHPRGEARALVVNSAADLQPFVAEADLVVSLLPATHHRYAAELCLQLGKHMVTTSYVSPAMREFDAPARDRGLTLLNECGVDPGIDHMSAMRVIDGVRARGGQVAEFSSYCGGLPAPEANTNPWGYKFSWSPRGVLTAATNAARYLKNRQIVEVPGPELFAHYETVQVPGAGAFEGYPNRDSLIYQDLYGLQQARGMFRGTLRMPGHCRTWKKMAELGLFSLAERPDFRGLTLVEYLAKVADVDPKGNVRAAVARRLGLAPDDDVLQKFAWLGLFSAVPLPPNPFTALDILAGRMAEKMPFAPGERDMLVMQHEFVAEYPDGRVEHIRSTLIDYGEPNGDSSMARTVSLPAAIAVRLILEGQIVRRGVVVPVTPDLYEPILNELETLDIACRESYETV